MTCAGAASPATLALPSAALWCLAARIPGNSSSMQANIHSEGTLHCGVEEAGIHITHSTAVVSMLWIKTMKSFKHRRITIWAIRGVGARARSPVSPGAWCDCRDSRPSSPHHLHQGARMQGLEFGRHIVKWIGQGPLAQKWKCMFIE